jgi:gliding motility-associated-like protein
MYNLQQPLPIFAIIPEPELPLCFGEQTLVTVDTAFGGNGGPFYFTIDNGVETPLGGSVLVYAGEHLITVIEDGSECTLDSIITVVEPPQIVVDLGPDIVIELGDSARLEPVDIISALPLDSVAWDPLTYLSFANDPLRPWCRPIESLTYTLTVFDINGCVGFDEIYVDVDKNRNVFIPNIFSPNGDGANDEFFVNLGPGAVKANYMRVFDRWGELLYEKTDILPGELQGWDGYFRGKVVDSGVLVYIIEVTFEDNITLLYRGDLTVVK